MTSRVTVIIPALNEEEAIGEVVRDILAQGVCECIVVDNGSTDRTAANAASAGAHVVSEPRRGYGRACASGVAASNFDCDVIVFLDGDGSDVVSALPQLAASVLAGTHDFVIGSRIRGHREEGSMLASQVFAGKMAGMLLRRLYGIRYTDMGPFRVISRTALDGLHMSEMTYGWNLEMQMKAARQRLRILELPVDYRCRQGGVSKVAGSLRGSFKAAIRILRVFVRIAVFER